MFTCISFVSAPMIKDTQPPAPLVKKKLSADKTAQLREFLSSRTVPVVKAGPTNIQPTKLQREMARRKLQEKVIKSIIAMD